MTNYVFYGRLVVAGYIIHHLQVVTNGTEHH